MSANQQSVFESYDWGAVACLALEGAEESDAATVAMRRLHDVLGAVSAGFRRDFAGPQLAEKLADVEEWARQMTPVPRLQGTIFQPLPAFVVDAAGEARKAIEGGLGDPDEHRSFVELERFLARLYDEAADRHKTGVLARTVIVTLGVATVSSADERVLRAKVRVARCQYEMHAGALAADPFLCEWQLVLSRLVEPDDLARFNGWIKQRTLDDIAGAKNYFTGKYKVRVQGADAEANVHQPSQAGR